MKHQSFFHPAPILLVTLFLGAQTFAALNAPHTEPLPPKWALGYIQSFWNDNGEALGWDNQDGVVDNAKALRGIDNQFGQYKHPFDAMMVDIYWCGKTFGNFPANVTWDAGKFPNPQKIYDDLHGLNVKVSQCYHADGLSLDENGQWVQALKRDLDMGQDWVLFDFWGSSNEVDWLCNYVKNYQSEKAGKQVRPFFWLRHKPLPNDCSGEKGQDLAPDSHKKWLFHWGGDKNGNWCGYQESIQQMLGDQGGAMSGWSYFSNNTTGHWDMPDLELSTRWIHLTDFSTITCQHGHYCRMVWCWGQDGYENSKFSRILRYRLLPYIYTNCWKIWEEAMPLTRPMKLAFPGQKDDDQWQYMFGDEILHAAVAKPLSELPDNKWPVFLPGGGQWVDYWTHEVFDGGQTIQKDVSDFKHAPLFVKRNSIIPMGPELYSIVADGMGPADPLTLDIYPETGANAAFTLYEDDGESDDYQNGMYATTGLGCTVSADGDITVEVAAMSGDYAGKAASRTYIVKINLVSAEPSSITSTAGILIKQEDFNTLLGSGVTSGWGYDTDNKILYAKYQAATDEASGLGTNPSLVAAIRGKRSREHAGKIMLADQDLARCYKAVGSMVTVPPSCANADYALVYDAGGRLCAKIAIKGAKNIDLSKTEYGTGVHFVKYTVQNSALSQK